MPTVISPPAAPTRILDRLLLGTLWNAKQLLEHNPGVRLVLNCTDETVPPVPGCNMLQLGLLDGHTIPAAKLNYAVRVLHQFFELRHSGSALVCCHASISRSPGIVLAYLLGTGWGYNEALERIATRHPRTNIHHAISRSVRGHFGYAYSSVEDLIKGVQ